jgi:steroid delta-isomerase-like uncharacterized protein
MTSNTIIEHNLETIRRHFEAENNHDSAGILETYVEDVLWDDVTRPTGPVRGKKNVAAIYDDVFSAIPDIHFESVRRWADETHVVDESIVTGHIEGFFAGRQGNGTSVRFRLLHIFEMRDGLITYENAWFDTGTIARQLDSDP